MSDPSVPVPPPPPIHPPPPPKGRGLGWFFAISGSIVLVLTCYARRLAIPSEMASPSWLADLILGGVFLWLGSRRLKR
jgi:hypothetical protein